MSDRERERGERVKEKKKNEKRTYYTAVQNSQCKRIRLSSKLKVIFYHQ